MRDEDRCGSTMERGTGTEETGAVMLSMGTASGIWTADEDDSPLVSLFLA